MSKQLVVVYTAAGRLQADMIKGLLAAAGIPAEISQEGAGTVYGLTVGPLGLADILVAEEHAAAAKDIIEALERGDLEGGPTEADEADDA